MDIKEIAKKVNDLAMLDERVATLEHLVAKLTDQLALKSEVPCPSCGFPLFPIIEQKSSGPFAAVGAATVTRSCPRCGIKRELLES